MKQRLFLVIGILLLIGGSVHANPHYTDFGGKFMEDINLRGLSNTIETEDFNGITNDQLFGGATSVTFDGFNLTGTDMNTATAAVFKHDAVPTAINVNDNNTTNLYIKLFENDKVSFIFPTNMSAFGFEYKGIAQNAAIQMKISNASGELTNLSENVPGISGSGFYGVIDDVNIPFRQVDLISINGNSSVSFGIDNVSFAVTPVPEPSTYAALAVLGVVLAGVIRRHRVQTVS